MAGFPLGLAGYHCYLAMTAQTTWEHLRGGKIYYLGGAGYPEEYHPWDIALSVNMRAFVRTWRKPRADDKGGLPRPLTVWRLPVAPGRAVVRPNIFDNEHYSCC